MINLISPRELPLYLVFKPERSSGFTLIELLVTLSIIIILTTISTSTFSDLIRRKTANSAFDTLLHLVTFTRTKAIMEQEIFTLCASDDGFSCKGEWNKQIMVFDDNNKNAQRDSNEVLFKTTSMPTQTPCLKWNAGLNRRYLRFKPDGSNAGTAGHFLFCDPEKALIQKKLVVSFTGRTSIKSL